MARLTPTIQRILTTNSTATSYGTTIQTTGVPSGEGYFDVGAYRSARIRLTGTGSSNDDYTFKVYLWERCSGDIGMRTLIFTGLATLGTSAGISGGIVPAAEKFVDTIAAASGSINWTRYRIISPADNTQAEILLELPFRGTLQIEFKVDGGSSAVTDANGLIAGSNGVV